MAEFYISYEDIVSLVNKWTDATPQFKLTQLYKSEILAAITCNLDVNEATVSNVVSWWKNTVSEPSQFVLRTKYISLKDIMLIFLEQAIASGAIETIISIAIAEHQLVVPISTSSNIAIMIFKWLKSCNSLENDDFCVYLQARMHSCVNFCTNNEFTVKDLIDWFPQNGDTCNAHDSRWDCEYMKDDKCSAHDHINCMLKSLKDKNILTYNEKTKKYSFKW